MMTPEYNLAELKKRLGKVYEANPDVWAAVNACEATEDSVIDTLIRLVMNLDDRNGELHARLIDTLIGPDFRRGDWFIPMDPKIPYKIESILTTFAYYDEEGKVKYKNPIADSCLKLYAGDAEAYRRTLDAQVTMKAVPYWMPKRVWDNVEIARRFGGGDSVKIYNQGCMFVVNYRSVHLRGFTKDFAYTSPKEYEDLCKLRAAIIRKLPHLYRNPRDYKTWEWIRQALRGLP